MSEVKKIATRDSYGNALVELGKEHENLIVLDADLAGATKTCIFQKEFPVYSAGYGQIPKAFQFCIELLYDFVGIGFGNAQLLGYFIYSHKSVFVQIKYLLVLSLIF